MFYNDKLRSYEILQAQAINLDMENQMFLQQANLSSEATGTLLQNKELYTLLILLN